MAAKKTTTATKTAAAKNTSQRNRPLMALISENEEMANMSTSRSHLARKRNFDFSTVVEN